MQLPPATAAIELTAALAAALAQPRDPDLAVVASPLAIECEFSQIMKSLLDTPADPSADPVYAFSPGTLLVPRKYHAPTTDRPRRRQQQREK